VGIQALYLLAHQHQEEAASLLDWKRSIEPPSTTDPLGGSVFAHLWRSDNRKDPDAVTFASAALVADPAILRPLVARMLAGRESAGTNDAKTALDLLLATTYLRLKDAANAKAVCSRLLQQSPQSITAIRLAGRADALAKDWTAWKALLAHPLETTPADRDLLLESAAEAEAEGEFPRARAAYRTLLDSGKATPADYNQDAWLSLFTGNVDDEAIAEAQQATLSGKNLNYHSLHTLACLNAMRGNTAEAHQELLDAMNSGHIEQPNSAIWLGFGLIDEQYGERPAAIAAYRKVTEAPESVSNPFAPEGTPVSSYALAQMRLKALGAL